MEGQRVEPGESMCAEPLSFPLKSPSGPQRVAPCLHTRLTQCPKHSGTEGFVSSSQRDGAPYRLRTGASGRFRRHSVDGSALAQEVVPADEKRFNPYSRRSRDTAPPAGPPCSYLQERPPFAALGPALTGTEQAGGPDPWNTPGIRVQPSMFMEQSSAAEPASYMTPGTAQHQTEGEYSPVGPAGSSFYSFHSFPSQTCQDSPVQQLYPKPIYSYSILIFMALRNSRTGSLPVSEIYSFMTEHFPYFKTAPDGWKNSVRHNLSLNKCFEKVENKNGSSTRKGCLWALNPAKVEKMQEELQKWRRKDPVTVRRSMARPEDLDHLLGERSEKFKSFSVHLMKQTHPQFYRTSLAPSCSPATPLRRAHLSHHSLQAPAVSHNPLLLPSSPHSFSYYPSITQQPSTHLPPCTGSLDSPLPAHTPPSYSAALQASHDAAGRIQELLMEAEMSSDIDTLSPSLTDLQLHGHLWEELRNDSLAVDALALLDTSAAPGQLEPCQAEGHSGPVGTAASDASLQTAFPDLHITALRSGAARLSSTPEHSPLPLL